MIDFVKISLPYLVPENWRNIPELEFRAFINESTGEIMNSTEWAVCRGLRFLVMKEHCRIEGSIHSYHNEGKGNYNDLCFPDLKRVIEELKYFRVQPEKALLENIEFGVNISLNIPAIKFIKNVIAYKFLSFGVYKPERVKLGKWFKMNEYEFKIYDKGKQSDLNSYDNLLRIEMRVKRMRILKSKGIDIKTLSDLNKIKELEGLKRLLLDTWQEIVFKPFRISLKSMTNSEQKKYLSIINPEYWSDLNKIQRSRAKKKRLELFEKYSKCNAFSEATELLNEKLDFVLKNNINTSNSINMCVKKPLEFDVKFHENLPLKRENLTAKNCIPFHRGIENLQPIKMYTFSQLECTVKKYTNKSLDLERENKKKSTKKEPYKSVQNINIKKVKKIGQNTLSKKCKVCKVNISHKRKDALYCSKKCNNKLNGMKRTKKRKDTRQEEIKNLKIVQKYLVKKSVSFQISYKVDEDIYTDNLKRSEILAPPEWIRAITKVVVSNWQSDSPELTFTTLRAKEVIRMVNEINQVEQK